LDRGSSFRVFVVVSSVALSSLGCVTLSSYQDLELEQERLMAERDALETKVERLQIERDSFEEQFIAAQESYEDERVTRTELASDLAETKQRATRLDRDLEAERRAREAAAAALAAREAQLAKMQSTYDELVGDLEAEVSSGQIEIQRLREGIRLNVDDDVLFASGSAELDAAGRNVLERVADRLKHLEDTVEVRGHTDDRPIRGSLARRYPSNWELAAARAARVVRLLEERGVSGERLAVVSRGPNEPRASNDTAEGRARNRRIEIRLEPRSSAEARAGKAKAGEAASEKAGGAAPAKSDDAAMARTGEPAPPKRGAAATAESRAAAPSGDAAEAKTGN
jgi:chemotaxis protein MotB